MKKYSIFLIVFFLAAQTSFAQKRKFKTSNWYSMSIGGTSLINQSFFPYNYIDYFAPTLSIDVGLLKKRWGLTGRLSLMESAKKDYDTLEDYQKIRNISILQISGILGYRLFYKKKSNFQMGFGFSTRYRNQTSPNHVVFKDDQLESSTHLYESTIDVGVIASFFYLIPLIHKSYFHAAISGGLFNDESRELTFDVGIGKYF